MAQTRTVEDKFSDWLTMYNAVRSTITPEEFRPLMALIGTKPDEAGMVNAEAINIGVAISRIVMANDRMAASVAALLTANGVKPTGNEYTGEYPE